MEISTHSNASTLRVPTRLSFRRHDFLRPFRLFFVARSFRKHCPSFLKTLPVFLENVAHVFEKPWAMFFIFTGNEFCAYGQRIFKRSYWIKKEPGKPTELLLYIEIQCFNRHHDPWR